MYIKRQKEYTLDERGYIEYAQSVVKGDDKAKTAREKVDAAQQQELDTLAKNRLDAAEDRAKDYQKASSNRRVNKELGISVFRRNNAENVAAREARQAELKNEFDKNERKIARSEKWDDHKLAAKHALQDLDASYEDKTGRDLGKDAAIAGGVAAAGVAGYAAYKAWKKRRADKKAAAVEAESKFKKED